jgi:hypothetical protein
MPKAEVGDLVCMYRRKNKGIGIVLEYADDIIEKAEAGVTFGEFIETLEEIGSKYGERASYRTNLRQKAKHPEMIAACMLYNSGWAKKPKKEFVRIRWFNNPSMYEMNKTTELEDWYPIDWVKKV